MKKILLLLVLAWLLASGKGSGQTEPQESAQASGAINSHTPAARGVASEEQGQAVIVNEW